MFVNNRQLPGCAVSATQSNVLFKTYFQYFIRNQTCTTNLLRAVHHIEIYGTAIIKYDLIVINRSVL